jgi:hypothetical protein
MSFLHKNIFMNTGSESEGDWCVKPTHAAPRTFPFWCHEEQVCLCCYFWWFWRGLNNCDVWSTACDAADTSFSESATMFAIVWTMFAIVWYVVFHVWWPAGNGLPFEFLVVICNSVVALHSSLVFAYCCLRSRVTLWWQYFLFS